MTAIRGSSAESDQSRKTEARSGSSRSEKETAYVASLGMIAATRSMTEVSSWLSSGPIRSASRDESRCEARMSEIIAHAVTGATIRVLATNAAAIAPTRRALEDDQRPK